MVEFFLGLIAGCVLGAVIATIACKRRRADSLEYGQAEQAQSGVERAAEPVSIVPFAAPMDNRQQFVAAVSASIAAYLGKDVSGLRIRSIRRLSGRDPSREQFIAAVSAALATAMGTGPEGLRIRSIRRLSGQDPNRAQLVAAMSAAIATAMGTSVSAIRIHSIKRITV